MTLSDLIPSLRGSLPHPLEPWLWPASAQHVPGGHLSVAGVSLAAVGARYGTPSHVLDMGEFRLRCAAYRNAFHDGTVAYASRALLTLAIAGMVEQEGLHLDVCSESALAVAEAAGFPPAKIILHGNAKPVALLLRASELGVGRIVLDSLEQVDALGQLACSPCRQSVLLHVNAGCDTHAGATDAAGQPVSTCGLSIASGEAAEAVRRIQSTPSLQLVGFHCHVGSQVARVAPYDLAARRVLEFMASLEPDGRVVLAELNLGGGHAIAQHPGDVPPLPVDLARALRRTVTATSESLRIRPPRITVEPGRAIAGPAGVTLCRVLTVKRTPGRNWVSVDTGMSDTDRVGTHRGQYTARLIGRLPPLGHDHVTIVDRRGGNHDSLIDDALLPVDVQCGDLLAIPGTGAYHHSMASNDNLIPRPPIIAVAGGATRLLIRRETVSDLLLRDMG